MLLDRRKTIKYDYIIMATENAAAGATPTGTETGAPREESGQVELSPTALAREKAGKVIRPMLAKLSQTRAEDIASGKTTPTEGDKALAFYNDILTLAPFKPRDEGPIPLDEGSPLMIPIDNGSGEAFNAQITHISRLDADPVNGRVYFCIVEGPEGPMELPVSEAALTDAQLATADGDSIVELFGDEESSEKDALVKYRTLLEQRRSEDEPEPAPLPDDLLTTLGEKYPESLIVPDSAQVEEPTAAEAPKEESMTEIYRKVNAELSRQIERLEKAIEGLKGDEKKAAQDRLLAMKIAREFNGPLGSFYKADALDAAIAAANQDANMTPQQKAFLRGARNSLDSVLEQADHDFADFLSRQGLSEETLTEWQQIASDPNQGMRALLERPDVLALPNMQEQLGGAGFDPAVYDKLIDESHLTPDQKAWFKKAGIGGLWILGILFGLPAALIIGGGAGVVSLSGTLAKASQ